MNWGTSAFESTDCSDYPDINVFSSCFASKNPAQLWALSAGAGLNLLHSFISLFTAVPGLILSGTLVLILLA